MSELVLCDGFPHPSGSAESPVREWPETDPFDIFHSHLSPFVHLRSLTADGQWDVLKELASAEDAASMGITHSSSTSRAITGLRAAPSKVSQ